LGADSVDPALDLGNGLTLADYKTKTAALKTKNDQYNSDLSDLDAALNSIQADEKALDDLSARMLAGVGSKYGKDSSEYEQAGGTRTGDANRPRPKTRTKPGRIRSATLLRTLFRALGNIGMQSSILLCA
jgi:hypothetical protein